MGIRWSWEYGLEEDKRMFATVLRELAEAFVRDTRNDGKEFYKVRKWAPTWLQDSQVSMACHRALDDRFPDDWVYE